MKTARMANPGLSPAATDVEATWYIDILNASAIQNPRRLYLFLACGLLLMTGRCRLTLAMSIFFQDWSVGQVGGLCLLQRCLRSGPRMTN